uniref:Putative NosL protein n=1 Tax=Magnetococcus massalia (strain MO-1) TaxID=451514 RepID=A0A1S7LM40_MAGMO|nr:Putative NosL protein [Candidatus Magnetococcus massalia]
MEPVAVAPEVQTPAPERTDVCPVCGMFVAKYREWVATVHFGGKHAHHFDGAKDLFKYLLDFDKYAPDHDITKIIALGVTEYYDLKRIDARKAWYVIGSDVLGPMGHELVPFASREDAHAFKTDHKGRAILQFDQITLALLKQLDRGEFPQ